MFVLANIFQPLIDINVAILDFFHKNLGLGWGMSIVGLTITIRLAILPLTFRGVRNMQALQRLQPEMKKLQERYKDDKQRQQQALMEFYREHEVNPLSSCLPLVLQFPFFIGLYQTLKTGGEVSNAIKASPASAHGFFFIPDLTQKATGGVLIALLIIYISTQLASSYVSAINIQDRNQKILVFAMPLVFAFVVINFPTGLLVYWITTNLFTIAQQLLIRRFLPPPEPVPAGAAAAVSTKGGGGGAKAAKPAKGGGDGGAAEAPPRKRKARAEAAASGNGARDGGPQKAPPRSPRKTKKRSGRRR